MRFKITSKLALLGLGLLGGIAAASAIAGDIYVIAHPSVTLTRAELKDVYLGDKQFAGTLKLVPVDNHAVQADFMEKVISMKARAYASLWTKKGFRGGLSAPAVKSGDDEVISFVKNTPGAIGYVSAPAQGVKDLYQY